MRQQSYEVELTPSQLDTVLSSIADSGYRAAARSALNAFLEVAGVDKAKILPDRFTPLRRGEIEAHGDVFFSDDVILYLAAYGDPKSTQVRVFHGDVAPTVPRLELGILSHAPTEIDAHLATFSKEVLAALERIGIRDIALLDTPPSIRSSTQFENAEFTAASLTPDAVAGAEVLRNKSSRELLIELSKAGKARDRDIFATKGRDEARTRSILAQLTAAGLVKVEYVVECNSTGTALLRLSQREELRDPAFDRLICAQCSGPYSKENVSEAYSLTDLGSDLNRSSHWMTVWVTHHLITHGVPETSILWNIQDGNEEIDLIVDFLSQRWVFELKASVFSAGHAYPFNFRQSRYRPHRSLIVTTDGISTDAKAVILELTESARRTGAGASRPIYIDSLDEFDTKVLPLISSASVSFALNILTDIDEVRGFPIQATLREVLSTQKPRDEAEAS